MGHKVPDKSYTRLLLQAHLKNGLPEISKDIKACLAYDLAESTDPGSPLQMLRAFKDCIYEGVVPPPTILAFLAEGLEKYFSSSAGVVDLDYALGVKSKQRHGSAKAREEREHKINMLLAEMYDYIKLSQLNGQSVSKTEAARKVLLKHRLGEPSENTLVDYYRQRQIQEIMDFATEAINGSIKDHAKVEALLESWTNIHEQAP